MNILVTGGAGFIASHIVDRLIMLGHRVAVVDNLLTGRIDNANPFAELYRIDICDPALSRLFASFQPEIVIHHAAQTDVQTSFQSPVHDAQINILGTINLLEQCRHAQVRKIIYPSSAAVYGSAEHLHIREDDHKQPLSFYGLSKLVPEQYIQVFADRYGIDYTILRYSNVYGSRQKSNGEGGVVSIFMDRLQKGETPLIYGDGNQTRDFIYVQDIVSANLAALSAGSRRTYNVSSNREISINQLLLELCEISGSRFAPRYLPARAGEIVHSCLDNAAARVELGWEQVYTLRDGLRDTWESCYSVSL